MKKYGRIDAPVEVVRRLFGDAEAWPLWMPGIVSVDIKTAEEDRLVVATRQRHFGRSFFQLVECRLSPDSMEQIQLRGWARKWLADWRFSPAPEGTGTTVACEMEVDLGLTGFFLPRRTVQRHLDGLFEQFIERGQRRTRVLVEEEEIEPEIPAVETVLRVYETDEGLEIWIDGTRYLLEAVE